VINAVNEPLNMGCSRASGPRQRWLRRPRHIERFTLYASAALGNSSSARRNDRRKRRARSGPKQHYAVGRQAAQGTAPGFTPVMLMPSLRGQSALPLVSAE
jgi:hypothetical protein